MTVISFDHVAPVEARGERMPRSAVARAIKAAALAIKQACKLALLLAGLFAVMIALAALDVWLPH